MSRNTHDQPGVAKYILAWVIASILTSIVGSGFEAVGGGFVAFISSAPAGHFRSLALLVLGIALLLIGSLIMAAIWIAVYSAFPSLRISAVIPWLWGFGWLGVVINSATDMAATGAPLDFLIGLLVYGVGLVIFVQIFRLYFKQHGRLDY